MKKISIKAFWLIIAGLVGTLIYRMINLASIKNRQFPRLVERIDAQRLERLSTALFRLNIMGVMILTLICVYFMYRLFANRKVAQGQKYITFLYVINIIVAVVNTLLIITGRYDAIISLTINAFIIMGCYIQRKHQQFD